MNSSNITISQTLPIAPVAQEISLWFWIVMPIVLLCLILLVMRIVYSFAQHQEQEENDPV